MEPPNGLEDNAAAAGFSVAAIVASADAALAACFGVFFVVDYILGLDAHVDDVGRGFAEATLCEQQG